MPSPLKCGSLDPMPTFLLRQHVELLTPYVTAIVNASLSQGRLPDSQKHAIILLLLKKPGPTFSRPGQFSSSIESVLSVKSDRKSSNSVAECLGLLRAVRRHHWTVMATLRVVTDALTAADNREVTPLAMLDVSAASDCVEQSILIQRLQQNFNEIGVVRQWLTSFLSDRTQQMNYDGLLCAIQTAGVHGVPQGSVLGPLLFTIHTAGVSNIIVSHSCHLHLYADDIQVYMSVPVDAASSAITRLYWRRCNVVQRKRATPEPGRLNSSGWGRSDRSRKLTSSMCRSWRHQ